MTKKKYPDLSDIPSSEWSLKNIIEQASIFDSFPGFLVAFYESRGMEVMWANDAVARASATSLEKIVGHKCYDLWHPGQGKPCDFCPVLTSFDDRRSHEVETQTRDGRSWSIRSAPVMDRNHRMRGILEITVEITERKRGEITLHRSQNMLQAVLDAIPAAVFWKDRDSLYLGANRTWIDAAGIKSVEDVVGKSDFDLPWTEEQARSFRDYDKKIMESGVALYNVIEPYRRVDGTISWAKTNKIPLWENGEITGILGTFEDITERKRAEESLQESERKYRDLADSLPLVIFEMDTRGLLTYVNHTAFEWFGYTADDLSKGINVLDLVVEKDRKHAVENIRKVAGMGQTASTEYSVQRKDGSVFPVLAASRPIVKDGKPAGIRGTLLDLTERKNMEGILNTAQKLESLGVLAGGIAHDFNNLLTGIFGFVDLARSASRDAQAVEYLEETLATIQRARALTLQLLTFAKGGAPVMKVMPLVPFIKETVQFALSGLNISCRFFLAENLWLCNIDKNQIGQVIDNIVINAQQAMPGGGSIEVSAGNILLKEKEHPLLAEGRYVKVSIKDYGIGIPKEILPRIFDPFYTTKTKGHGLGLATCYSIISRHGGYIDVESEPGHGSTFHIFLPASADAGSFSDEKQAAKHKGSGTILVMDDEKAVRGALPKMLESIGYEVVCKNDGREAVDFYITETGANRRFAALIFDLTVPGGMGGKEAVAKIREFDGKIPVFVASGYADDPVMMNPADYGFTASISKPFTIAEISEMLNKFLKVKK